SSGSVGNTTKRWLPLANETVNGVSTPALFVRATLLVVAVAGSSGSSKLKLAAPSQSDCRIAPLVGLTETNCGRRKSGNRKLRVMLVELLAESVARTVTTSVVLLVGASFNGNLNVLVTDASGAAATLVLWV